MQRWVERTEARWALWAGIVGALATAALSTKMILSHGSAGAGLGFVFLPLVAAAAAVPVGIWGAALGHVVAHLRGRAPEPKIVFWAALVAAASLPSVVASEVWHGRSLEAAVAEVRRMDAPGLERAFVESGFRRDKYCLGALAEPPSYVAVADSMRPSFARPVWITARAESLICLALLPGRAWRSAADCASRTIW